ncbi:MAG: hypothetical protein WAV98_02060, partial [Minisyncoccia bacterium]
MDNSGVIVVLHILLATYACIPNYFELRNSISVIASRYSDVAIYVFVLDCHALRARKDRIISSFV